MCCAGSCAGPCATRRCWARASRSSTSCCRCSSPRWAAPIPNSCAAEALTAETFKLEEKRFLQTLDRGLTLLTEASETHGRGRQAARRDRLQALRHLRLPARSDAGRAAPARHRGRCRRLPRRRWRSRRPRRGRAGRAPARRRPRRSGSRSATASARPSSSATTPRRPKARSSSLVARRRRGRRGEGGREVSIVLNQTPFYARVRRPARRHRHDARRGRPALA